MKPCDENRLRITLFLDDELRDQELAAFESHLAVCPACQAALAEERRFLDDLHSARPLYSAPPDLRSRVENILRHARARHATAPAEAPSRNVRALTRCPNSDGPRCRPPRYSGCWPLLWVGCGSGGAMRIPISSPWPSRLTTPVTRKLPLEMHSASPAAISDWVNTKAPFKMHLPSYDETSAQSQPYQYEGARLVSYHKDSVAYVAYRTEGKPVSLLALPTTLAPPLRGRGVKMKSLTIYYDAVDNFHVITWSGPRSRLTYALVTDLEHPSQSCIICHASSSPRDRDLMAKLRWQ